MQNTAEKMEASFADESGTESQGSLLTFADMALALDIFTADHTYALHDEQKQPVILERAVKLKDHNYSFIGKQDRARENSEHEDQSRTDHGYSSLDLDQKSHKRSLSEENLSKRRVLSSNPVCIKNTNSKGSQEYSGILGASPENVTLCNSWPKRNYLDGIENKTQDHTYARDEFHFKPKSRYVYSLSSNKHDNAGKSEICNCKRSLKEFHDSDCDLYKREKSIKFDHAYFDKPTTEHVENQNLLESKSSIRCDHAYFDKAKSANHNLRESNVSVKIDHAYFDKPSSANQNVLSLPEVQREVTVKSDHAYSDQIPAEMLDLCINLNDKNTPSYSVKPEQINPNEKQLPLFGKLRNKMTIATDHAYQGNMSFVEQRKDFSRSIVPTFTKSETSVEMSNPNKFKDPMCKPRHDHNYYNGSVESLDINFSSSDTDSCDETAAEVTRLAFSAWCQLRKDHPYSSI